MKSSLKRKKFYLSLLPILFLLMGCKPDAFDKSSISQTVQNIVNYSYSDLWYNIKTSFKIATHSKFYETQKIKIETPRDTQISAFQSIITECQTHRCNIKDRILEKNRIFPENITGRITLDISSEFANGFINAISKYGNVVINSYEKNDNIEKDIDYFTSELTPLKLSLEKTNELLGKPDVFNYKQTKEMQEYFTSLNEKIFVLENDIKYLDSVKNTRHIEIVIKRGYNSTQNLVKANIQDAFLFIAKYIHIFAIIIFILIIKYLLRFICNSLFILKVFILKKINQQKTREKSAPQPDFKIPPKFQ